VSAGFSGQFHYMLRCPCGTVFDCDSEDELVEQALEHLRTDHADREFDYEREHVLAMSQRLVRPAK